MLALRPAFSNQNVLNNRRLTTMSPTAIKNSKDNVVKSTFQLNKSKQSKPLKTNYPSIYITLTKKIITILKKEMEKMFVSGIFFIEVYERAPVNSENTIKKNPKAQIKILFQLPAFISAERALIDIRIMPITVKAMAPNYILFIVSLNMKYATTITNRGRVLLRMLAIERYTCSRPVITAQLAIVPDTQTIMIHFLWQLFGNQL